MHQNFFSSRYAFLLLPTLFLEDDAIIGTDFTPKGYNQSYPSQESRPIVFSFSCIILPQFHLSLAAGSATHQFSSASVLLIKY